MIIKKAGDGLTSPRVISHYTTLEGLQGIVETSTLWASNASFLNDRAELQHALDVSEEVIKKLSSKKTLKAWSPMLKRVFAVDIPSGLDSDTGLSLGATVRAHHTATIASLKISREASNDDAFRRMRSCAASINK